MIKKSSRRFGKVHLLLLAVLVIVAVAILELTNTTHLFHKAKVPSVIPVSHSRSSSTQTSQQATKSTTPTSGSTSSSSTATKTSLTGGSSSSSLVLTAPYGTFVSNHRPGQDGSPTEEQSTCITTQGGTCYIQFTNTSSGQTTKLPAQVVGTDGSTYWSWNANILTSGSWEITAVATLNGQTKSATDPTKLEIQ